MSSYDKFAASSITWLFLISLIGVLGFGAAYIIRKKLSFRVTLIVYILCLLSGIILFFMINPKTDVFKAMFHFLGMFLAGIGVCIFDIKKSKADK